ncbi:2a86ad49-089b-42fc-a9e4-0e5b924ad9f8 [Thermothielavioides terrestris]|uniref:NAD(P)-binding domain-containing protein n=2 Tax=Thermothielavioides terrestris TaxID=2587410 RepID=G2RCZ3_THETT|nr:uncharacterized protein THITE_2122364 [Thermothielavioides terrestris NRRL 8126]AEO70686.1 hypothetical protein THITE_2122364 [Thermothielavioides terrestris NRRL 8126]SPQ18506.1 2a86ad49-089b-42fc-a9e4-0e5b924ad9f8 [Thermothielavioides terrestris]
MKVIVTGCNGLVGSALVRQCIANPAISHVFALTRKPLPEAVTNSPKATVIEHDDFSAYPPELLARLAGAEGCLWAIGGRAPQFPDVETARKVHVEYTQAAAKAFLGHLVPQLPEGKQFRFVFCSGALAEWDQQKPLYFMADTRRIKGETERGLCEIADGDATKRFAVYCARPSGILPADAGVARKLSGRLFNAIGVDQLAKAMVRILLEGYKERIIENSELQKL